MLSLDVFRARAFRLAPAFCLAVSVATAAAFALIYLEVSRADDAAAGKAKATVTSGCDGRWSCA
jgi:hypothetical protein